MTLTEILEKQDIYPIEIKNKSQYYSLINELSNSFTSRVILDLRTSSLINIFIMESGKMLSNSIKLYELGYFDSSYYSMRTAIELSTIMLDLSDNKDEIIKKNISDFRNQEYRKMRKSIIDELKKNGLDFKDIKNKMPNFLKEIEVTTRKLNKVVHKTGFSNFYTIRNNQMKKKFYESKLKEFEEDLKKTIKIVAIMRLIVDPLPLILSDENLSYRCSNFCTFSFSDMMLNEIIGIKTINNFKKTNLYKMFEKEILTQEKRNEATNDVVLYEYINLNKLNDIYSQKHLLSETNLKFVNLSSCSDKIIKLITDNGFTRYSTSSLKSETNICNPLDYEELINLTEQFNIKYHNIYLSILTKEETDIKMKKFHDLIYIFHHTPLNFKEIKKLKEVNIKLDKNDN